jgi:hypothetical protein
MNITRREMTTLTISTCFAAAFPMASLAETASPIGDALRVNPKDALFRKAALDKTKVHVSGVVRKEGRHNPAIALDHSWKTARHSLPKGGATVIIDKEGNWSFSGLFASYSPPILPESAVVHCVTFGGGPSTSCSPAQRMAFQHYFTGSPVGRNAALVLALQSSLGYVMTFGFGGWVDKAGLSWNKQGHDAIVKDLWPDVVKGHKWYGTAVFSPVMLKPQKPSAHQEGNSALGEVANAFGTVGSVILSLF